MIKDKTETGSTAKTKILETVCDTTEANEQECLYVVIVVSHGWQVLSFSVRSVPFFK